jgi:hypothetical protein
MNYYDIGIACPNAELDIDCVTGNCPMEAIKSNPELDRKPIMWIKKINIYSDLEGYIKYKRMRRNVSIR